MSDIETLRQIVLTFRETTEEPHFEKASFRVKKKIFATYDFMENQACIKLSEIDQSVFASIDKNTIFPVPNKWGKQGWTFIKLDSISREILTDALTSAYCEVAPKKLSEQVKSKYI